VLIRSRIRWNSGELPRHTLRKQGHPRWQPWLVVCKSVGLSLRAVDLAEDLLGVLGPGEGPGVVVPVVDERADGCCQLAD
jgi:hypothetical protein